MKKFQLNFSLISTEIRANVVKLAIQQLNANGFLTGGKCEEYMLNGCCLFFGGDGDEWTYFDTVYNSNVYTVYHPLNDWAIWSVVTHSVPVQVKLNRDYTAVVNSDNIRVGCQTFPHSVIEELCAAVQKYKKK